jgi:hypothetical protein
MNTAWHWQWCVTKQPGFDVKIYLAGNDIAAFEDITFLGTSGTDGTFPNILGLGSKDEAVECRYRIRSLVPSGSHSGCNTSN